MTQSPWDGSNNQVCRIRGAPIFCVIFFLIDLPHLIKQLFQFPPASSASTTDSYAPRYDTIEENDDTPDWLGGPLTEDLNMVESPTQRFEQPHQQHYQQPYQHSHLHQQQAYSSPDPAAAGAAGNNDFASPLPFRRHSLAHEPLLSRPQQQSLLMRLSEKRASLSGASPSASLLSAPWSNMSSQNQHSTSAKKEPFGSTIWSTTSSPSTTQTSFLWDQGTTSPSYAPSPTSTSSSLFPRAHLHPLSEQSVFPAHGVNEMMRPGGERRRLSLTPMPSDHQPMHDYFRPHSDMLSRYIEQTAHWSASIITPLITHSMTCIVCPRSNLVCCPIAVIPWAVLS